MKLYAYIINNHVFRRWRTIRETVKGNKIVIASRVAAWHTFDMKLLTDKKLFVNDHGAGHFITFHEVQFRLINRNPSYGLGR